MAGTIKGSRPYDASGRRHAAQRRRDLVVDAAGVRFRRDGYAATTVADVAGDSGVSVEFIYKAFGSKAGLVRAIWDRALLGQGTRPAPERSDDVARAAQDPETILANWARLSAEVSALGAPIQALIKAAAVSDDGAAALLDEVEAARRDRMEHNADYLLRGGFVRPGLTPGRVRDVLMLAAGELYEIVVLRYGWPTDAYVDLVHRFLRAELLPDSEG